MRVQWLREDPGKPAKKITRAELEPAAYQHFSRWISEIDRFVVGSGGEYTHNLVTYRFTIVAD